LNTVSTNYSLSYLFLFPFSFLSFPIIVLISSGSSLITCSCSRTRFIPLANWFGIVWHPAASDKETTCQSSSVRLTQVGLGVNQGMGIWRTYCPLGLVLPDIFLVRDIRISLFGLGWWVTSRIVYLFRITLYHVYQIKLSKLYT
jgi:hypothetical protein